MVIKKPILAERLVDDLQTEFERLERLIDDQLYKEYVGDKVYVHIKHSPHPKVMKRLIKVYGEENWFLKLEFGRKKGACESWFWIEIT